MSDRNGDASKLFTRRDVLHGLGITIAAAPLAHLIGCGDDAKATGNGTSSGSSGASSGSSGASSGSSGAPADGGSPKTDGATSGSWATGGTKSMTGAASYPDPFAAGIGNACALTCASTLGPCYTPTTIRKDISEGRDGLPTRFAFLVVDEACKPIANAEVDIWHTAPKGVYSGAETPELCTLGDAEAQAANYFRGKQITDANGRADFDTCFPGWYGGRTVHIHFTVRVGGVAFITSQLVFDDALVTSIVAGEPIYSDRGPRDTTNQNDGVISAGQAAEYSFTTAKMSDGAMLASKALVLRSSTGAPLCNL